MYRSRVLLRLRLSTPGVEDERLLSVHDIEPELSQIVKDLLAERLVKEAVLVCQVGIPFLPPYSQEEVNSHILERLLGLVEG